jgi:hypothetical protein
MLKSTTAPLDGRYAITSGQAYRHKAAQSADLKQLIIHLFNDANCYSNCSTLKDGHEKRELIRMGSDVIISIESYPAGLLIQKKKNSKDYF